MATENCANCDECVTEGCLREIQCLYSCGCCCTLPVRVVPNRNIIAGTISAQRQSDEFWDAFDPTAVDGLQIPRGVFRYDVTTDAKGRIMQFSGPWNTNCGPFVTNSYFCGTFRLSETLGNLTAALSHEGFGRIIEGFAGGEGSWKLI